MENQELKETVLCNLRSVTQSCKGGVPINRLERDYRDLIGSRIPYRELGYNSLESFVQSIPSVLRLTKGRDGSLMAEAVADSSTAHIASLISRQKQPKIIPRVAKRSHFSQRRGGYNSRYAARGDRNFYGSYSAAKSSGRSYKQDVKVSPGYHSKTSPPNFKIEVKNTNYIPRETTPPPIPGVSSAAPPKSKPRAPVVVRGYEVPPRFQNQHQKTVETKPERLFESSPAHSNKSPTPRNSATPSRNSATPPRTPTPTQNPYAFTASSIASTSSSRTSPTSESLPLPARSVSNGAMLVNSSAIQRGNNEFYNSKQRSPRPLRARLNVAKSSQQLDSARSAKEYLEIYAKMNNLSVEYSTKTIGQRKKNKGFVTILHLGENRYLSYPDVAPSEMEAEEIAAQNAVEKIKESQVLPETPISNAEEIQILLNRIEEIVCEKPSGMFINGLQAEYENHFKEQLPSYWVDLLQQSSVVDIDEIEVSYGKVPDGANFIVRPSRGLSSGSTTPSETSGKMYTELQDSENEEQLPSEDIVNKLAPPLVIPAGNEWGVFVTGVYATDTSHLIAARLVDSDNDFLLLLGKMASYYDTKIDPVDEVVEGSLYATIGEQIGGELLMHRVLACSVGDEEIGCYYVDVGTVGTVRKSDLQHLHNDFLGLPYQAIHFALDGLEDYIPFIVPEHLSSLIDRTFIAIVKRWCSDVYFPDDPAVHKVIYSVMLYDTSDEEDICVNDTIKKIVSESDSLVCKLPKLNVASQGYLTHVTKTGQIYVRFLHPVMSWLEIALEELYPLFEEACLENSTYIPSGKIFVAKCKIDGKWYRAVVPEHPSVPQDPEVMEVIFVDYGYPGFVKKSEICDLHLFSDFLSSLTYQAIKCELYNALPSPGCKWTIPASQKLLEMAPFEEELIIRVIIEGEADVLPKISLHKRIYSMGDSLIISINENLANKPELFLDLSAASSNGTVKAPSKLNLQRNPAQPSSRGSLTNFVPSAASPVENSVLSPLNNLDVASPDGIQWVTTPDMVKSPDDEDLLPPPLSQPQVPEKGQIFDVYVTTAANPHNFIVQPLKSSDALIDLRIQMQQFYSVEENLIEMHPSLLQRNSFYAALHSDNEWYRARLVSFNTNEPDEALVCYVDFGDYDKVRLQNLQKLYNQFRALPCQAIKASLSGIMPIDVDWNPVHCVKFKEIVTDKTFVSIVQSKCLAEEQGFPYLKLDLSLVDTSVKNQDTYVHELLIQNSMALKRAF